MRFLGNISRIINRLSGGKPNQSLCARIARAYGHDCWFCRMVGAVTRDRDHCWSALVGDVRRK
jgi:hypothetical protein